MKLNKKTVYQDLLSTLERLINEIDSELRANLRNASAQNKIFITSAFDERNRKLGEALQAVKAGPRHFTNHEPIEQGALVHLRIKGIADTEHRLEWWLVSTQLSAVLSGFESGGVHVDVQTGDLNNHMGAVLGKKIGDQFEVLGDGRVFGPLDIQILAVI